MLPCRWGAPEKPLWLFRVSWQWLEPDPVSHKLPPAPLPHAPSPAPVPQPRLCRAGRCQGAGDAVSPRAVPHPTGPQMAICIPRGCRGPRAGDLHGAGGFAWGEQGAGGALRRHVCPSLRLHGGVFACRCACVCLHSAVGVCTALCVSVRPRWVLASRGAGHARATLAAPCAGRECASCAGLGVGARRAVCCSWRAACPAQPGCFVPPQDVIKAAGCTLHPSAA